MTDRLEIHVDLEKGLAGLARAGFEPGGIPASQAHPLASSDFEWPPDLVVRWAEQDTSRCVAAIVPAGHTGHDARRFLNGAERRGEVALGILEIDARTDLGGETHTALPHSQFMLKSTRLPHGVRPRLSEGLDPVDKDLAIRLIQASDQVKWAELEPLGLDLQPPGQTTSRMGVLESILEDDLGKPLAAFVIPSGTTQRWYVVPNDSPWERVVDWLDSQAIRKHVPEAIYRANPSETVGVALLTPSESQTRQALERHEAETAKARERLETELRTATSEAELVRTPLLFGHGHDLKKAVAKVLEGAGFDTEDLDETAGEGFSADLLAREGGRYWLVEVTSSAKAAKEREWTNLKGHLLIWPTLRPERLESGVLIINNDHSRPPEDRQAPYRRPEFLNAIDVPVIGSVALYDWWRRGDQDSIRAAVTGPPMQYPTM